MTFESKFKVKLLKAYILNPQSGSNHKCVYDYPKFYARETKWWIMNSLHGVINRSLKGLAIF